jgi:hypothetical protein
VTGLAGLVVVELVEVLLSLIGLEVMMELVGPVGLV